MKGIKFLTRVEIEINQDDLQRNNRQEIVTKQEGISSFEPPTPQPQQNTQQADPNSGNRRQRRLRQKWQEKELRRKDEKKSNIRSVSRDSIQPY
ncbi:MAG: hypothetical protein Ct9H90mP4_11710 [Gammaproteobacteria bacterium]|nr:MAG: hypothetical protein Ct9H90mP4_11710 [Gammaproteobacteria bacterium]